MVVRQTLIMLKFFIATWNSSKTHVVTYIPSSIHFEDQLLYNGYSFIINSKFFAHTYIVIKTFTHYFPVFSLLKISNQVPMIREELIVLPNSILIISLKSSISS